MNQNLLTFKLIFVLGILAHSCNIKGSREVDIVVTNNASDTIRAVEIYFAKHFVLGPHFLVGKGYSKTYIDYPYAVAERVQVEWTVAGREHKKEVDLKGVLPPTGDGRLIFEIRDDAVSARFERKK